TSSPGFSIRDGWVIADVGGHKGIFSVSAATRARNVMVYTRPGQFRPVVLQHSAKQALQRKDVQYRRERQRRRINLAPLSGLRAKRVLAAFYSRIAACPRHQSRNLVHGASA